MYAKEPLDLAAQLSPKGPKMPQSLKRRDRTGRNGTKRDRAGRRKLKKAEESFCQKTLPKRYRGVELPIGLFIGALSGLVFGSLTPWGIPVAIGLTVVAGLYFGLMWIILR